MAAIRWLYFAVAGALAAMWPQAVGADVLDALLSPSGRYLALEDDGNQRHVLAIFDNDDGNAAPRTFNLAGQKVTDLAWASETFVRIFTTQVGPGRLNAAQRAAARNIVVGRNESRIGSDIERLDFTSVYALDLRTMRAVQMLGGEQGVAFTTSLDDVVSLAPAAQGRIVMRAPMWLDDPSLGSTPLYEDVPPYGRLDPECARVQRELEQAFAGKRVDLVSVNLAARRYVFSVVQGPQVDWLYYDDAVRHAEPLGSSRAPSAQ